MANGGCIKKFAKLHNMVTKLIKRSIFGAEDYNFLLESGVNAIDKSKSNYLWTNISNKDDF